MDKFQPRLMLPKFHKKAGVISFENHYQISKVYREVLGLKNIKHISINIVENVSQEMSVISSNPYIIHNLLSNGLYKANGSISPSYYLFRDSYSWDETFDQRYYETLKNQLQRKNTITKGMVLVKRTKKQTFLYSFATGGDAIQFVETVNQNKKDFYRIGDHCLSYLQEIYHNYIT